MSHKTTGCGILLVFNDSRNLIILLYEKNQVLKKSGFPLFMDIWELKYQHMSFEPH